MPRKAANSEIVNETGTVEAVQEEVVQTAPVEEPAVPEEKNRFAILNAINVSDHVEKKNGLSYLSWAWAWTEFKKVFPDSNYKVYERDTEFGPVNYFTDGRTCSVKVGVTLVDGDYQQEHIEYLPVMDHRNAPIAYERVTSTDVNKAIQRAMTKAIARHGLGCYIYAGEDMPEESDTVRQQREQLQASIDSKARAITSTMTDVQKADFFTNVIEKIIGQKNYRLCSDIALLGKLDAQLTTMMPKAA